MAVEANKKIIEKNESCQVSKHEEESLIQVQIFTTTDKISSNWVIIDKPNKKF
jgi:hypothetical protein